MTTPDPPTVLITGANRGLGRRSAELLAQRGWRVLVGCRNLDSGQATAAALRVAALTAAVSGRPAAGEPGAGQPGAGQPGAGGREPREPGTGRPGSGEPGAGGPGPGRWAARAVQLDVTDPDSIAAAATRVAALTGGRLTALVNNAGVFLDEPDERLETLTPAAGREIFAVNALGPVLVTQAVLGLLRAGGGAAVVNVSSDDAYPSTADGTYTCYRMSKAALNMMTTNLAIALRPDGIVVNSIDPGWIPTDMGGPEAPDDLDAAAELVAWAAALPVTAGGGAPSGEVFRAGAPPWAPGG